MGCWGLSGCGSGSGYVRTDARLARTVARRSDGISGPVPAARVLRMLELRYGPEEMVATRRDLVPSEMDERRCVLIEHDLLLCHRGWTGVDGCRVHYCPTCSGWEARRVEISTHSQRSPGKESWIGGASGRSGLSVNYVVWRDEAAAELYIDTGDRDENKRVLDSSHAKKGAIEAAFSGPWSGSVWTTSGPLASDTPSARVAFLPGRRVGQRFGIHLLTLCVGSRGRFGPTFATRAKVREFTNAVYERHDATHGRPGPSYHLGGRRVLQGG